jgi:hypothetical protein
MSKIKTTVITSATLAILTFGMAAPSMAAPCRDDNGLAKKVFTEFVKLCEAEKITTLALCGRASNITTKLKTLKAGLENLGITVGNSWLAIPSVEIGRFSAVTNPRFTTDKPVESDNVTIRLVKTGGRGGVGAVICAIDDKGVTKLGELEIEDGASSQEVVTRQQFTGIKGKVLQVQLNGIGNALQTMKFKLNVQPR